MTNDNFLNEFYNEEECKNNSNFYFTLPQGFDWVNKNLRFLTGVTEIEIILKVPTPKLDKLLCNPGELAND